MKCPECEKKNVCEDCGKEFIPDLKCKHNQKEMIGTGGVWRCLYCGESGVDGSGPGISF